MITRSKGFSLIELLVVVAILGIISAIGIVSYSGYVEGTKKKSVENAMMQMSLAQTEFYSNNGYYYPDSPQSATCKPQKGTDVNIEKYLLGDGTTGPDVIPDDLGYFVCGWRQGSQYGFIALEDTSSNQCEIKMSMMGTFTRGSHC